MSVTKSSCVCVCVAANNSLMVSSLAIVSVLDTANAVKQRRSSARALTSLSYFLQIFSELLPREVLCDIFCVAWSACGN